jgi:hypothetical protein
MFGFKKRQTNTTQSELTTSTKTEAEEHYFAALLSLVHSRWPNIEEAKNIAAQIAFLAQAELEMVAPAFKNSHTPAQRAIAAALYVTISKSGVSTMGKESLIRIFEATKGFAHHSGEISFYNTMGKSFRIF